MPKNMGAADRIIRTLLAIVVIVLFLTKQITGLAAIILGIFAVIFLLTSAGGSVLCTFRSRSPPARRHRPNRQPSSSELSG